MNESDELRRLIVRNEGMRLKVYTCPSGKLTIGVGRNLEDVGLSNEEANLLLENDIRRCELELRALFSGFDGFAPARKAALLDMIFNLGRTRFMTFARMRAAVEHENWEAAADEALCSRWAAQVGRRAHADAEMLRDGEYV